MGGYEELFGGAGLSAGSTVCMKEGGEIKVCSVSQDWTFVGHLLGCGRGHLKDVGGGLRMLWLEVQDIPIPHAWGSGPEEQGWRVNWVAKCLG